MPRWLTLLVVALLSVALALSTRLWLPPLLEFVAPRSDLIQGLQALVQMALWVIGGVVAVFGFLRRPRSGASTGINTQGGTATGNVEVSQGDFVGRDQWVINVDSANVATKLRSRFNTRGDLTHATAKYLESVLSRHRYLSFKGMGVADRVPLKLPLLDLYVPLKARQEMPEGATWQRHLSLAGRALATSDQAAIAGRLSKPTPVLKLLQSTDGLIVLGDPGSGKTTFLKFLALAVAAGHGTQVGLGERLPVLVPLSGYANALAQGDTRLDEFIADYFHDIGGDLPLAEMLQEALEKGSALVLLDGLDEVKDLGLRHTVVTRVIDFYSLHRTGNKFVLTSRIVGYRDVRPSAEGLAECTLVDFEDDEIADFLTRWTAALENQAQGETAVAATDAAREREELLDALAANPGVRSLAANPLLLTILALMKRQGVTLPERRVQLYEKYVETMLSSWNKARSLSGRATGRDLDVVQTLKILAPLALWMHQVNPGLGLVRREDLRRRLEDMYRERGEADPQRAAAAFMEDLSEHAGLLLERGPGEYGFIHLTFEEYLAGVAIAWLGQRAVTPIVDCLAQRIGTPGWHEVARLAVAYLGIVQQRDEAAGEVVEALIECQRGAPGEAIVLAGEAVLDASPGGVSTSSRERATAALVPAMQSAEVAGLLRHRAGIALGRLGWRPPDLDQWVEVPAGDFLYGDDRQRRDIPYRYWIGKYPVTNSHYAIFVEDGGYRKRELWREEGWRWREQTQRHTPAYWGNSASNNPILPVVGVSWYEAQAYCNWLDVQGIALGDRPLPAGYRVRLPTEDEWERAARGTDGREFPWTGGFQPAFANTSESEIGGTSAVCAYPQGVSPTGAWDMAGNAFEWTISPRSADDSSPVLRGGSWFTDRGFARCAFRYRLVPVFFDNYFGFRVVVYLANSDS